MKDDTWAFHPYIQHSPSDFTTQPQHQKEVSRESKLRRTNSWGKALRVFLLILVLSAGPWCGHSFYTFRWLSLGSTLGNRPRRNKAKPQGTSHTGTSHDEQGLEEGWCKRIQSQVSKVVRLDVRRKNKCSQGSQRASTKTSKEWRKPQWRDNTQASKAKSNGHPRQTHTRPQVH